LPKNLTKADLLVKTEFEMIGKKVWVSSFVRLVYVLSFDTEGFFDDSITTTAEHPFMVFGRGWTPAAELKVGDFVETLDREFVKVNGIQLVEEKQVAYNLEVDEYHTYAVGEEQYWVHNTCRKSLPDKKVVESDGVTIEHYYKSGDHPPAHLHVNGQGTKTKIGQNGKPIKGSPELSSSQQKVVKDNLSAIRKTVKKIGKYLKNQEEQN
jgi:hypothetical protein